MMKATFSLALLLATTLSVAACSDDEPAKISRGSYDIELDNDRIVVKHGSRTLLRSSVVPAVRLRFDGEGEMLFGRFMFSQEISTETPQTKPEVKGSAFLFDSGLRIEPSLNEDGLLKLHIDTAGMEADGWRLQFECGVHENFVGFGEQYSFVDMKGRNVPIWTEENGLGRQEDAVPPLGELWSTYYPMPYFMDPRGMGFVADSTAYQEFSLCEDGSSTWSVEVWQDDPFDLYVLPGPSPMEVVSQLTTISGRPQTLPDWAFDLWLSAQGGTDKVKSIVQKADDAGIPWSAVWSQDWLGQREFVEGRFGVKYRWAWDPEHYPGLTTYIAELHDRGKRFLGYFNPFIPPTFPSPDGSVPNEFYETGKKNGWLIEDETGEPYLFPISVFEGSLVDMTNPEAVEWFKGYAREAVEMGIDGWMSDFGEWLPWDAVIHEGTAPLVHNLYPTLWHKASREVLDEMRPDGDYVMFTRSGHLREMQVAQIVWAGDQEADWDIHDGFPTAVRAMITMGLSGIPYVTHDIAGFSGGPSTKELWMRWVELGAFTPIMRMHDGLAKFENWNFYSDTESSEFLKRFSSIHTSLKPYLKTIGDEAVNEGKPLVRSYLLVDGRKETWFVDDAFFLGNDVLVAPVLKPNTESREVEIPEGEWRGVFGQGAFTGPQTITVDAPIGKPAVFVRVGTDADGLLTDLP